MNWSVTSLPASVTVALAHKDKMETAATDRRHTFRVKLQRRDAMNCRGRPGVLLAVAAALYTLLAWSYFSGFSTSAFVSGGCVTACQ